MPAGNLAQGGVTIVGIAQTPTLTFYLASAIAATDIGKPVKLDTTASNRVALAGDGDAILGVLESYEDRAQEGVKTGAVTIRGGYRFNYPTGDAVAVGDSIVGSAVSGEVKKAGSANKTLVIAKNTSTLTVDVFIGL